MDRERVSSARLPEPGALAALINQRLKELPGSRPGKHMTHADLTRATGLPRATIAAYTSGRIAGTRLTPSVLAKLETLAKAIGLPVSDLIAAAEKDRDQPDLERELLTAFRRLTDVEKAQALFVVKELRAIRVRMQRQLEHRSPR